MSQQLVSERNAHSPFAREPTPRYAATSDGSASQHPTEAIAQVPLHREAVHAGKQLTAADASGSVTQGRVVAPSTSPRSSSDSSIRPAGFSGSIDLSPSDNASRNFVSFQARMISSVF